jgi:ABC-2 type transport system permease protein
MSASPDPAAATAAASGTIYDIGYRHYDGPRLGRPGAVRAMVTAGLRSLFGLGRSGRSKIIPWGAVVFAALPAFVAVAVRVLAGEILEITTYERYLWDVSAVLPIFVAAQTPELVINDIRHRVLPLYFSRPIQRSDYVGAKLAALTIGLLSVTLLPVLLLFLGRVMAGEDVIEALSDEAASLPAIIGNGLLHAFVLACIGLAISCLAGRRAYAAGAILGVFLIGGVVSAIFAEMGGTLADVAPFVNPLTILDGTREWLFGGPVAESPVQTSDVPLPFYGLATLALTAACLATLWFRYRRITA